MKKYLAKLLPVEGKIEVGDRWSLKSKFEVYPSPLDEDTLNYWNKQFGGQQDFTKAGLFLCSRDIQAGDEVLDSTGTLKGKTASKPTEYELSIGKYTKVIGEVSPYAYWVVEGMEFDDSEVAIAIEDNWVPYNCIPEDTWEDFGSPHLTIGILGPCKHFH